MPEPELECLTAEMAEAAGIPVFVWCLACASPSRPLNLVAVRAKRLAGRPIAELARAGVFRCSLCGKRNMEIMPTLDGLVIARRRLRICCPLCNKDQALTAAEAVARFGLAMPFDELRRQLKCSSGCGASAGAMIRGEAIDRSARRFFT